MGINLENDKFKGLTLNTYNKIGSINFGSEENINVSVLKYSSKEHRHEDPRDILSSLSINLGALGKEDMDLIKSILYKYVNKNDIYKNGTEQ